MISAREAPSARRGLELVLGPAAVDRLLRVEDREMAPDDLVGTVALDALRAGIPRRHAPFPVQQEDGVIAHALDQQAIGPVAPRAPEQLVLR